MWHSTEPCIQLIWCSFPGCGWYIVCARGNPRSPQSDVILGRSLLLIDSSSVHNVLFCSIHTRINESTAVHTDTLSSDPSKSTPQNSAAFNFSLNSEQLHCMMRVPDEKWNILLIRTVRSCMLCFVKGQQKNLSQCLLLFFIHFVLPPVKRGGGYLTIDSLHYVHVRFTLTCFSKAG